MDATYTDKSFPPGLDTGILIDRGGGGGAEQLSSQHKHFKYLTALKLVQQI